MTDFLSDIGPADKIRDIVLDSLSQKKTVSLELDKTRTVRVIRTANGHTELIVRCKDVDTNTSIVLHLPDAPNSVGQATIISYNEGSN